MATSKVAIANLALQKLGAKRISALTQDHPNARSMSAAYEFVLKSELRRYVWAFAIKRASVAADGDESEYGGFLRYSLPNDFIRLIRDNERNTTVDWKREGLFILSKCAAPLEFRYVAHIDDPNFYDSLFEEAFATRLAAVCAKEISDVMADKDSLLNEYKEIIAAATLVGAIEKEAEELPEDDWVAVRR
jgi:hypothetical protein